MVTGVQTCALPIYAREERDKLMQTQVVENEEKMQKALSAMEEEHTKALQMLIDQKANCIADSEVAVLRAERALRDQLSSEWAVLLKDEVAAAVQELSLSTKHDMDRHDEMKEENDRSSSAIIADMKDRLAIAEIERVRTLEQTAAAID